MEIRQDEPSVERYLSINIGSEEYGLHLSMVREVMAVPSVTPVPNSPPHYIGLINLRGQIVPLVDLRLKFKPSAKHKITAETTVIICESNGKYMGAVVDSVNCVISINKSEQCVVPGVEETKAAHFITGVYKAADRLVLLIDLALVLNFKDDFGSAA